MQNAAFAENAASLGRPGAADRRSFKFCSCFPKAAIPFRVTGLLAVDRQKLSWDSLREFDGHSKVAYRSAAQTSMEQEVNFGLKAPTQSSAWQGQRRNVVTCQGAHGRSHRFTFRSKGTEWA